MIKAFWRRNNIYFYAGILSVGFTLLFLWYQQPFDPDGVGYLNAAQAFLQQGMAASLAAYHWPFYSLLIAFASEILHVSLLHAAFVVNAVLDTITVIVFIVLVKAFGGSRKLQWLSAFIILTYSFLNHLRYQVFRDHGYYAFGLLALLFLVYFCRNHKWRDALGWGVTAIIATLFRVEGAVFVGLLPLILLFQPKTSFGSRLANLIKAYSVQIIVFGAMLLLVFLHHGLKHDVTTSRLPELLHQFQDGIQQALNNLHTNANILAKMFFIHPSSYKHANEIFLLAGIIGLCTAVLVVTTRFWYFVLSVYALTKKLIPLDWSARAVWFGAMALNVLILMVFALQNLFVVNRYVAFLAILLLLAVPFALEHIYTSWKTRTKTLVGTRWLFPLLIVALIYTILGGIYHFGTSKTYIVTAGNWLNHNTMQQAQILTDDGVLMYYADRQGKVIDDSHNTEVCQQNLRLYDYAAIEVGRDAAGQGSKVIACMRSQPVQIFHNRKGDKVLIFKLK